MRKWSWIPSLVLAVAAAVLVAPSVAAEETAPPAPEPTVAAAADDDGCATDATQEIEALLGAAEAPMCPAATPSSAAAPEPILQQGPPFRRYCRCGCGAGCTTDADCGPGGRCVAFISCC